jgi:hypothetical protein
VPDTCAETPAGNKGRIMHTMIVQNIRGMLSSNIIVAPQFEKDFLR